MGTDVFMAALREALYMGFLVFLTFQPVGQPDGGASGGPAHGPAKGQSLYMAPDAPRLPAYLWRKGFAVKPFYHPEADDRHFPSFL